MGNVQADLKSEMDYLRTFLKDIGLQSFTDDNGQLAFAFTGLGGEAPLIIHSDGAVSVSGAKHKVDSLPDEIIYTKFFTMIYVFCYKNREENKSERKFILLRFMQEMNLLEKVKNSSFNGHLFGFLCSKSLLSLYIHLLPL